MVAPNNHGVFPTKNDHFGVFWGYRHLRTHPYIYCFSHISLRSQVDYQNDNPPNQWSFLVPLIGGALAYNPPEGNM